MPAAAVIPAPRAYMQVAAVEKLVVGFRVTSRFGLLGSPQTCSGSTCPPRASLVLVPPFTLNKFECFKQASYAWRA